MHLFLMRHATAEDPDNKSDFERNLTSYGQYQAELASKFLINYNIDKLLISPAKRTMQTADFIINTNLINKIEVTEELYHATVEELIDLVIRQENTCQNIMIIGHNPTIYRSSLYLANDHSDYYDLLITSSMPPARIVMIEFPEIIKWSDIKNNKGNIINIITNN